METWDLIRSLNNQSTVPWCLIGDMNNVLSQEDKKGGRPYPTWLISGFQAVLDDCDLNDMELQGYRYTWEIGHGTYNWIEIKLDRALVLSNFLQVFPEAKLSNLEVSTSDHSLLFLEPISIHTVVAGRRFKFENAWLRDPMCGEIVKDVWCSRQGRTLKEKLEKCSEVLTKWGKEITGSFRTRIKECKRIMKSVKAKRDARSVKLYQDESKKLTEIYSQQEIFWRQRSKQLWLRECDQNNKFFHASAKVRRKRNHITTLQDSNGCEVGWDSGLQEVMEGYFRDLFTSSLTDWEEVY